MTDACDPPPGEDLPDEAIPDGGAWRAFLDRTLAPLVPA